ncbi:hypothetical protein CMI44_00485 [Candidatus Pacearchaeota archaeon]|nr:hypothetical protein [Candidatus Pacearchaeota archaeon]
MEKITYKKKLRVTDQINHEEDKSKFVNGYNNHPECVHKCDEAHRDFGTFQNCCEGKCAVKISVSYSYRLKMLENKTIH